MNTAAGLRHVLPFHFFLGRHIHENTPAAGRPVLSMLVLCLLFCTAPAAARPSWATDAPCSPWCSAPGTPSQPTAPDSDTDGSYTVTAYDGTGTASYGWIVWNTGQAGNPTSGTTVVLSVSNEPTGTETYRAKACLGNNGGEVCSSWSPSKTVYVVRAPANPTIDATTSICGSLTVNWSPAASGYPAATHEKRYDLQQSINGGSFTNVSGRTNTTATSWSLASPTDNVSYSYRVRAWYVWNGYTSAKTGWVVDSLTQPVCPPTPAAPVLSEPTLANSQITVSWSQPPSSASYRLERRDLTTASAWTQIYSGSGPSHTDTGATGIGHTYEYHVRACNSVPNCSGWSSPAQIAFYQNIDSRYHYDALGRLVRVVENEAIRTGYCYDAAGNRYQVDAGSGGGENCPTEPAPPALPAPTGLSAVWQTGPSWYISWNPVEGAASYQLRLDDNSTKTVTGTSYTSNPDSSGQPPAPVWVQACTQNGDCGLLGYF